MSLIRELTIDIFKTPDQINSDGSRNANYERERDMWRRKIGVGLLIALLASLYSVSSIHGVAPGVELALASDTRDIQKAMLEEKIEKWQKALCSDPGNEELLALIRNLQDQYDNLTGDTYDVPDCELLMKVG